MTQDEIDGLMALTRINAALVQMLDKSNGLDEDNWPAIASEFDDPEDR